MNLVYFLACTTVGPSAAPAESGDTAAADTADAPPCHADADLDGAGDPSAPTACGGSAVPNAGDCDDADHAVHPGAPEVCNGQDDDCDGRVDDADDDLADGVPFWEDADGDGYGSDALVTACSADGDGVALVDGDCDDADPDVNPGADEGCEGLDRDCDGFATTEGGSDPDCPGDTCARILAAYGGAAADGAYWLRLPSGTVTEVWCDMTTDGGGWTLGFVRNTASVGNQGGFGAGEQDVSALSASPAAASASATPALGWLDLDALEWDELVLQAAYGGGVTYTSRTIPRDAIRIPFGSDGYYLHGGETGYYWCGGDASYTDSGVGATDNPPGAPPDCKGHGLLGSGWDFSESPSANAGLTLCGADGSYWLYAGWATNLVYYGAAGGAQAILVR